MPISSRACPCGAPAVTSLRPSRLATRTAGAPAESAGTVIPGGVTSLAADAALMASVPNATAAANAAPMPQARRRLVLLVMVVLPDLRPDDWCGSHRVVRRHASRRPVGPCGKAHSGRGEPKRCRLRIARVSRAAPLHWQQESREP